VRAEAAEEPKWDRLPPVAGFPAAAVAESGGVAYAATFGGGLRRLPGGERVEGVPDVVTSLAASPVGLLCGTTRGLYVLTASGPALVGPRGLPDENVSALAVDAGRVWVGHLDGGLSRLSQGHWKHWGVEDGLPSAWVEDLVVVGPRLWGATAKGVFWIEGENVVVPAEPELRRPTAALAASGGVVYAAQSGRLVAWRDARVSVISVDEPRPRRIWAGGTAVWLAGASGLHRLAGGRWTRLDGLDGTLPGDWITAGAAGPGSWLDVGALAARDGQAAVGGSEDGLHLFSGGAWTRLTRADGLPGDGVSAVAFDDEGALWVGTRTGLARVRPAAQAGL
jgi:hypothetical protein